MKNIAAAETHGHTMSGAAKLSAEEIFQLRDTIMENSRRLVDPEGTGFDPQMSSFEHEGFGGHILDEAYLAVVRCFLVVSSRISFSIISAGGIVAAGIMYGHGVAGAVPETVLGVSGFFAFLVLASVAVKTIRAR